MSIANTPSLEKLHRAVEIAEAIAKLNAELSAILNPGSAAPAPSPTAAAVAPIAAAKPAKRGKGRRGGKRALSPEARERIAAAQRVRWAKARGDKPAPAAAPAVSAAAAPAAPKKASAGRAKGQLSPEARERIAAAQRIRWAKWKKAKK